MIYGVISDDMNEFHPGMQAAKEKGIRGSLQEANLFKEEIRELSRELHLPTWDKTSIACLSSRIAYGGVYYKRKADKGGKSRKIFEISANPSGTC
ncbi:hypothetical protein AM1BK_50240 [Neobacillus kokaensis]|uniref:Uncharacterized protein n=1 Tax=Neobacillus kokaensis TaxID=2759023 RepID=A0ABQ3NC64_9BACI|nr:hypothetical protein AM1BK_50240 [Neobacillus kokaensis]